MPPIYRTSDIDASGFPMSDPLPSSDMSSTRKKGPVARTDFGWRLYNARKAKNMSQKRLAQLVGVQQNTVSDAERIAIGSKHTVDFAKHLGVHPEWLATGNERHRPGYDQGISTSLTTEQSGNPEQIHGSALVTLPLISGGTLRMMDVKNDDPKLSAVERIEAVHPKLSEYAKAYRMPDDSLGPRPSKGDILEFDTVFDRTKLTGDSIVMVSRGEDFFVRRYDPIEIAANGLTIVAKMKLFYFLAED
jgi:hypothetical protein